MLIFLYILNSLFVSIKTIYIKSISVNSLDIKTIFVKCILIKSIFVMYHFFENVFFCFFFKINLQIVFFKWNTKLYFSSCHCILLRFNLIKHFLSYKYYSKLRNIPDPIVFKEVVQIGVSSLKCSVNCWTKMSEKFSWTGRRSFFKYFSTLVSNNLLCLENGFQFSLKETKLQINREKYQNLCYNYITDLAFSYWSRILLWLSYFVKHTSNKVCKKKRFFIWL